MFPLPGQSNLFPTYIKVGTYIEVGSAPATSGEVRLTAGTINAPTTLSLQIDGTTVLGVSASLLTAAQALAFTLSGTPASTGTIRLAAGDTAYFNDGTADRRIWSFGADTLDIGNTGDGFNQVYLKTRSGGALYLWGSGASVQIGMTATGIAFDCGAGNTYSYANVTTATAATAGAATLPANPVGFIEQTINGTAQKIPYYAV